MDITNLRGILELLDDRSDFEESQTPWIFGKNYFVRTVTMSLTGRLTGIYCHELTFSDAAWIADTGRFADALAKSEFNEVEPFPEGRSIIVGRGGIIDAVEIDELPKEQK